jgi:4'-phosphopantetheinyl transferase
MVGRPSDAAAPEPPRYDRRLSAGVPSDARIPLGKPQERELHVWTLALDVEQSGREQRAAAGVGLRVLLGSYLDVDPHEVEIRHGAHGRPELAPVHDLCFNLSHTAGIAVYAIGRGRAIGVDVEALDRRPPSAGLIERALNAREAARFARVGPGERTEAFLRYWTVKEAYAKALGLGLALDLRQVGVEGPAARPRLDLPGGSGEWHVRRLRPRADVIGALVADGGPWRMRLRELRMTGEEGPGFLAVGQLRHPLS